MESSLACYLEYQDYIEYWCKELKISQAWVVSIIWQESKGDQRAYRSEPRINDASFGLMQILWSTAQWIRDNLEATRIESKEELYDPKINIEYGTRYFKYQLDRYKGCYACATAAYNSGTRYFTNNGYVRQVQKVSDELKKNERYQEIHRRDKMKIPKINSELVETFLDFAAVVDELSLVAIYYVEAKFGNDPGESKLGKACQWLREKLDNLGFEGLDDEHLNTLLSDYIIAKHRELKNPRL